jgi:hypothetical protein
MEQNNKVISINSRKPLTEEERKKLDEDKKAERERKKHNDSIISMYKLRKNTL